MSGPLTSTAQTNRPDPHQDRPVDGVDAPSRTGRLLGLVRKLIDYGKGLASTLQQRTAATNLFTVTLHFGTTDIALILSRITRGLLRAAALEARLISRVGREQKAPAHVSAPSHRKPRAAQPAARRAGLADSRLAHLPGPAEIAADVRRRPIGAVLADICLDLGIVPSNPLWRELHEAITINGGGFIALFRKVMKRGAITNFFPPDTVMVPPMPPGWRPPSRSSAAAGTGPP